MTLKNEKFVLSIDLGTSGPKSAIVSTRGEVVDFEFEPTPILYFPDGGAEQDPEGWWKAIIASTQRVLGKNLVPKDKIAAICCTTQWSGTVAVDKNGHALMNAVIWMDSRGSPYIKQITGGLLKIEGYEIRKLWRWLGMTGGAPAQSGKGPLGHILYIKHQFPEIYEKTYKFLEPKDYINLRLTGEFAASFDSIALHWVTDNRDPANISYNDRLIRMSTVDPSKFPRLKQAVDVLGPVKPAVADELGLRRDVQVVMGTPDVPCAAIGSGAVGDFEAHLYIGTSSWLSCHVPFKKTDIFHSIASLPSAIPGRYFIANEQETAGACLTYLKNNILYHKDALLQESKLPDVYKIFDQIVENVPPGSDKLIFTPWLYGERTPVESDTVRACLFNQSLRTTREHIIRAVFEGVAYNSRWLLGYVEKFTKRRLDPIRMIGGGANSNVWCQIHADILDRTIHQVKNPIQANFRGAAFLASAAMGHLDFEDIPDLVQIENSFSPDPKNRNLYDELFGVFLDIYKCNKRIYAKLNRK